MSTMNSYDVSAFKKSITKLNKAADRVAKQAVNTVLEQRTINRLSLDEIEAVPFAIGSSGNIVISSTTQNIAELDELVTTEAALSLEALRREVETDIRRVLK